MARLVFLRLFLLSGLLATAATSAWLGNLPLPAKPVIMLALLGDVMLGRGVAQAHADGGWEHALIELAPLLAGADLALANLESPLAQAVPPGVSAALAAGEYNLCAPAESVQALAAAGLDVLALANNHAHDCSPNGLAETAWVLNSAGMEPLKPAEPLFLLVGDLSLALLAYDDISAPLDLAAAEAQVRAARARGALVMISVHWGAEYHSSPSPRQQQVAQRLVQAGAALVWGHHPHTLQPVNWLPQPYDCQRQGHNGPPFGRALVAYSLGNALFDQVSPPDARRSAVLLVTLNANGVQAVQAAPAKIDPLKGTARLADEAAAEAVFQRLGLPIVGDSD